MAERRLPIRLLAAVLRHPHLWPSAAAMVPPRWWRRWPPLPLPTAGYLEFREQTMYGGGGERLGAEDLIAYLEWCRRMRRASR